MPILPGIWFIWFIDHPRKAAWYIISVVSVCMYVLFQHLCRFMYHMAQNNILLFIAMPLPFCSLPVCESIHMCDKLSYWATLQNTRANFMKCIA